MVERKAGEHKLVGRATELVSLRESLENAKNGKGSTILISGEPGIGKTALVEAFKEYATAQDVKILAGAASADSAQPFLVFSKALGGVMDAPLFEEQEYTQFLKIFAVNQAGMLVAQASSDEEEMDADIFAGMLSAVQNFVGDSLGQGESAGLGRLEYGDMKILIEHGKHLFLTGVFSGGEHSDMKGALRRTLQRIEEEHAGILGKWSGKVSEVEPIREEISKLTGAKFLVRRDLEGIKLENERLRIADRVLDSLAGLCSQKPQVLILEDLHWADESSLFVINYLARNIRKERILLLGTSRPGESDALEKAVGKMMADGTVNFMALEKLGIANTVSLIDITYSPNDFPGTLAERLYEQSKGNPLFVLEMLRGMRGDGSIAEKDGKYTLVSESYIVPATVEDAVNHRLETLDPDSMAMIEYASCIGQTFDASVASSNRLVRNPEASLSKLSASGILVEKDGAYEFSHAVFQSVIYCSIGERWKAGHHRSLGEHLEHNFADRMDEVMYDLARHFSKTNEFKKHFDYCIRAGEKAEGAYAAEQAIIFYESALGAFERGGTKWLITEKGTQVSVGGLTSNLYEKIADNHHVLGRPDQALSFYNKALKTSESSGGRLSRKLGQTHLQKGDYDTTLEYARKVLESSGETVSEISGAHNLICSVLTMRGDYKEAIKEGETAVRIAGEDRHAMARAVQVLGTAYERMYEWRKAVEVHEKAFCMALEFGDLAVQAATTNSLGIDYMMLGDYEKSLELFEKAMSVVSRTKDINRLGAIHLNLGNYYRRLNRWEEAIDNLRKGIEIQERIGNRQALANGLHTLGIIHDDLGRWAEAKELHGRSLVLKRALGDRYGQATSYFELGSVSRKLGDLEKALDFFGDCLGLLREIGNERAAMQPLGAIATILMDRGDVEGSLNQASEALRLAEASTSKSEISLALVRVAAAIADRAPGEARKNLERAMELAAETEENGTRAEALIVLARMGSAEGQDEMAIKYAMEALEIFRAIASPLDVARCEYAVGMAMASAGRKEAARSYLESSCKTCDSLGAKFEMGLAQATLEALNR